MTRGAIAPGQDGAQSVEYTWLFTGAADSKWETRENWVDADGNAFTGWTDNNGFHSATHGPGARISGTSQEDWNPYLFDGDVIAQKGALAKNGDGKYEITLWNDAGNIYAEGWNLRVGVYNNVSLEIDLFKFQGQPDNRWIHVDATSNLRIRRLGDGSYEKNHNLHVASENGITIVPNYDKANAGFNYYLTGAGSVRFDGDLAAGTAGKHAVKAADFTISADTAGGSKIIAAKRLVSVGGTLSGTIATSGAYVAATGSDGTAITPNLVASRAALSEIGDCFFEQDADGLALDYVDYGRIEITGVRDFGEIRNHPGLFFADGAKAVFTEAADDNGEIVLHLASGSATPEVSVIAHGTVVEKTATAVRDGDTLTVSFTQTYGKVWLLDYEFDGTLASVGANAASLSASNDGADKYANGARLVSSTPWREYNSLSGASNLGGDTSWSAVVRATAPALEDAAIVTFGGQGMGAIALVTGAPDASGAYNKVKLVRTKGNYHYAEIAEMTVPSATSEFHVYGFTKSGNAVNVYCDGELVQKYAASSSIGLGVGVQIGAVFNGNGSTGIKTAASAAAAAIDFLRIVSEVVDAGVFRQIAKEHPYEPAAGTWTRTVSGGEAEWAADGAWTRKGTDGAASEPSGGYVELTADADAALSVNAASSVAYDRLTVGGAGAVAFASAAGGARISAASLVAETDVSVAYGAVDLSGARVTLADGRTLAFDLSDFPYADLTAASTVVPLTGFVAARNDGAYSVRGAPADGGWTVSLAFDEASSSYRATIAAVERTYRAEISGDVVWNEIAWTDADGAAVANPSLTPAAHIVLSGEGTVAVPSALRVADIEIASCANVAFAVADGEEATLQAPLKGAGAFAKAGGGVLTLNGNSDGFTGGVTVRAGTVKIGGASALGHNNTNTGAARSALSKVVVEAGGAVDLNGVADNSYWFVIAGDGPDGQGAVVNGGSVIGVNSRQLRYLDLSADASIRADSGHGWGLVGSQHNATGLDLAGHRLVKKGAGEFFVINATIANGGALEVAEGAFGVKERDSTFAAGVLKVGASGSLSVATDKTLSFGGGLDLTAATLPFSAAGLSFTAGTHEIAVTEAQLKAARAEGSYIATWSAAPDGAKFVPAGQSAWTLAADDGGLKARKRSFYVVIR